MSGVYHVLVPPSTHSARLLVAVQSCQPWKVRVGDYKQAKFPYVLGRDFSGVISAVGEGVHARGGLRDELKRLIARQRAQQTQHPHAARPRFRKRRISARRGQQPEIYDIGQRRRQNGQALVEFAVVANILVVLLLAIVQFGVVWMNYIAVTDAAREGARRAAVNRSSGQSTMVSSAVSAARAAAPSLQQSNMGVSVTSLSGTWNQGDRLARQARADAGELAEFSTCVRMPWTAEGSSDTTSAVAFHSRSWSATPTASSHPSPRDSPTSRHRPRRKGILRQGSCPQRGGDRSWRSRVQFHSG